MRTKDFVASGFEGFAGPNETYSFVIKKAANPF
jgi:hypothetical protein